MSAYRPASFKLYELVPPEVFHTIGERGWELLDKYALVTLQTLRDRFGRIIVNDWKSGGQYTESGLRLPTSATGVKLSQHKFGRAFDCKIQGFAPAEAASYILAHPEHFPYLTTLENTAATPTWLHFDTRNHQREGVWVVNP